MALSIEKRDHGEDIGCMKRKIKRVRRGHLSGKEGDRGRTDDVDPEKNGQ